HAEEVKNGSPLRRGKRPSCAFSGPGGLVKWLCASQNDLPDHAPAQCKCGRRAKRPIGHLHRVLAVRTPLCIRLDHDAHRQTAGWPGPEAAGVGRDLRVSQGGRSKQRVTVTRAPWSRERGIANAATLPLLLLIGFAGGAESQAPPSIDGQAPRPYRISMNVDLVVLHATVRDRKGRFASDLREQDFGVYEDGVRQSIRVFRHEDIPVTVGLVVDHSGSMVPKLTDVIAAARTFVPSSNQEYQMFVVNFNERVTLGLPGALRFTNRPDELESAILKAPATGQTALYDAVVEALKRLQAG